MPDGFDFDKFNEEWEASLESSEEEIVEDVVETVEEVEEIEEQSEPEDLLDEQLENEATETEELIPDLSEEERRNASFAQLRRERDALAQQTEWMQQLADENGITLEQMKANYEEARLAKQAEKEGVPVEVLQKLNHLEAENKTIFEKMNAEKFNSQVSSLIEKHTLTNDDVDKTFAYAAQNGYVDVLKSGQMSVEDLYFLAHKDEIVAKQVEQKIQESLSQKKKRQEEAHIPSGASVAPTEDSLDERAKADAKRYIEEGYI